MRKSAIAPGLSADRLLFDVIASLPQARQIVIDTATPMVASWRRHSLKAPPQFRDQPIVGVTQYDVVNNLLHLRRRTAPVPLVAPLPSALSMIRWLRSSARTSASIRSITRLKRCFVLDLHVVFSSHA